MQIIKPKGLWARARGLKRYREHSEMVMVLEDCNSIHTIGMKGDMDLWGLDENGMVVYEEQKIKPNQIRFLGKTVKTVVECYSATPMAIKHQIKKRIEENYNE